MPFLNSLYSCFILIINYICFLSFKIHIITSSSYLDDTHIYLDLGAAVLEPELDLARGKT